MPMFKNDDENISGHSEEYYEELASQEELYREETEEELRMILIFDDLLPSSIQHELSLAGANKAYGMAESVEEQLRQAAEELITGDSDDPPLSAQTVADMLGIA